jgi:fucose 4-O-acetylase-like acetyltransferase
VYDTVRILLSQGVCQIAVPVFFLISGYLFFVRLEEWTGTRYKEKMKRRVRNLVVPFLLWGLIALAVELAVACYKGASPVQWLSDRGWILPLWNNGRFHFNGARNILGWTMYNEALPLDYPLWFVRELIVLNLFAPAIHWWVRKTKAWGLAVLFLLYLFNIWIPLEGFHAGGTFFYSLGAYWRINRQDLTVRCRKWAVPAGIVSLLLLVGMVLTYQVHHPVYTGLCRVFTLTGSVFVGYRKQNLHPKSNQSATAISPPWSPGFPFPAPPVAFPLAPTSCSFLLATISTCLPGLSTTSPGTMLLPVLRLTLSVTSSNPAARNCFRMVAV